MSDKISIIVPVYNAEEYLSNCLESIQRQSYIFFEVILVNDGSTDGSLRICNEYCAKDNRFFVYTIKNSGPSAARNYGISRCTADLVTYIDSDDFVANDFLETLITNKQKNKADISAVGLLRVTNYSYCANSGHREKIIKLSGVEAVRDMLYQRHLDTSPCCILFEKHIAVSCPFPVGKFHEDDFTMYKYYESCKTVVVDTYPRYYYVQHENSIMHKNGQINYDELEASDNLVEHFEYDRQLYRAAVSKKYSNYCQLLMKWSCLKKTDKKAYEKIIGFLKKEADNIISDKEARKKNRVAALLIKIGGIRAFLTASRIFK